MTVALIASFFTNPVDPASLDPMLLSPVIRRFLPKKNVQKQDVNMALLSGYKVKKKTKHIFFVGQTYKRFVEMFDSFLPWSIFKFLSR
jgi:hypothetical protein